MPPTGKEVMLTEREREIMQIFVKYGIMSDRDCASELLDLSAKLMGNYAARHK